MKQVQATLESLYRASMQDTWQMMFFYPDGMTGLVSLHPNNGIKVGPRLREVLSSIEKEKGFPRTITSDELKAHGLVDEESFTLTMLANMPVAIEISIMSYRKFLSKTRPKPKGVHGDQRTLPEMHTSIPEETSDFTASYVADADGIGISQEQASLVPGKIVSQDYLLVGKVLKVLDGDTLEFEIEKTGIKTGADKALEVGKKVTIRLAGLNTPETVKKSRAEADEGNKEYVKAYGVTQDQAIEIGNAAKKKLEDFLEGDGYVVIEVDSGINGEPKKDVYGRYISVVYKTDKKTTKEAFSPGYSAPIANKMLMGTQSGVAQKAPLAMPFYHFIDNEYSRVAPVNWLYQLGIRKKENLKIGDAIKEFEKEKSNVAKGEVNSNPTTSGLSPEIKYASANNQIDFMSPLDDRAQLLFPDGVDARVRIGDVLLAIPPLSIEVNRASKVEKIKTLRSKSSMMIKAGSSVTTLTMQLYFHDTESINGRAEKMHEEKDRMYYMDGLRPLIAQFKKAPFVPIDNQYINETLGIDSVALVNLSVQTVPNFPQSISATLTLAKFEHEAYMIQTPRLGNAINYPMLRWYYQESLRDVPEEERNPFRTYLKPVPQSGVTNSWTFQAAVEEELMARKQAIRDLRFLESPIIAKDKLENAKTEVGKQYKDGIMAEKVLAQYEKYMEIRKTGKTPKERTATGYVPDRHQITYNNYPDPVNKSLYISMYGEVPDEEVLKVSHYAPFESYLCGVETSLPETSNGVFKLRLYSQTNIQELKKGPIDEEDQDGDLTILLIPGLEVRALDKIIERGREAEKLHLGDAKRYDEAKTLLNETEGYLSLEDKVIDGLIPLSVTMMYENQFSSAQLQAMDSPSLQFLGGQDPYVQVIFEATETAVQKLQELVETVDRYAREYRTGITSGFLGVKNDLTALFGVDTVMVENIQTRTVPGFPDRFEVQMSLCGFNKTQKRTEQLEGLSPIYGDAVSKDGRHATNYEAGADEAIIELRMRKLEAYPDLELPTYEELRAALPFINADCTVYDNRTQGTYVDPDFYVATPITAREIIRKRSKTGIQMTMNDMMGVEMTVDSNSASRVEASEDVWAMMNSVDDRVKKIDPLFSWDGAIRAAEGDENKAFSEIRSAVLKDVKEYASNKEEVRKAPEYNTWKRWDHGGDVRLYEEWLSKKKDPSEWEVYNEIYKYVDELWVKSGYAYNDKKRKWDDEAWQKITYADVKDMHAVHYNYLAGKSPALVKSGSKEMETSITQDAYKNVDSKIPRERIANILKTILHVKSGWKQFTSAGTPIMDGGGVACGIGGVPLTEAQSVSMAQRLLWDWKYNLKFALNQMFGHYQDAASKKDIRWSSHPWNWMVTGYGRGNIDGTIGSPLNTEVESMFNSFYNSIDKIYATPTAAMNIQIMQQKQGLSSYEVGLIRSEKEVLIQELMNVGYRDGKKNSEDTQKSLKSKSSEEVKTIYKKHMGELFGRDMSREEQERETVGSDQGTVYRSPTEINNEDFAEERRNWQTFKSAMDYVEDMEANHLVNKSGPQDIFPEMFTDMIEYDQRFRLIRAFPTFQMFIIDEGRWMTNYKLWDNLYGFNAIQSIDVHKSRKIAADTAIIKMTNIYSNLTSRTLDSSYGDWDAKFWDNLIWGNPSEQLLEARKELLNAMFLQTGARIHLRIGYSSNVADLPVVFNGTITEMSTEEVVEIIAQGDGIELGNVISGDPDDTNKDFLKVTEPRDLICKLMTSKGNWFKDVVNYNSDNQMFKENPLGVMHFGVPGEKTPPGNVFWYNKEYGEAAQNIYSSNGLNTFSQWSHQDGTSIGWDYQGPVWKWPQPGDEANIVLKFYNNTTWDIAQSIAYCTPDYIAAVHPFELRSTLFFGKPYWRMAYRYDSRYEYDESQKSWVRYRELEHRKPYSQFHIYDSSMDIISNKIKASEEGVYTNVIANYEGKQSPIAYADWDIRYDKQKTTVVDTELVADMPLVDFYTAEKQATYYAMSTVRDYMKDMYKGELLVLGDPTVKPHDLCYMNDVTVDMNGSFGVKAVTHHFSVETGFITSIQPDANVVNDDMAMVSLMNWCVAAGSMVASSFLGYAFAARLTKKLTANAVFQDLLRTGKDGSKKATQYAVSKLLDSLPNDDPDVAEYKKAAQELGKLKIDDPQRNVKLKDMEKISAKLDGKVKAWEKQGKFTNAKGKRIKGFGSASQAKATVKAIQTATQALSQGVNSVKSIRYAMAPLLAMNPLALAASLVATTAVDGLFEKYRRTKSLYQVVLMMPLMYQGRQYTAGINGHKGMVIGDASQGKLDAWLEGAGLDGKDGEGGFTDFEWLMDAWNFLADANGKKYNVTEEDIQSGTWRNE